MKRFIVLFFVLVISTMAFAGCSNEEDVLTVGVTDDYPPMSYRDESGTLVGFEIDLAKAIADEMGKELRFVVIHREQMMGTLKDRTVDVLISSVSMTQSKAVFIDFSEPYLDNGQVLVTRPDMVDVITSIESLEGKSVGVEAESVVDDIATSYLNSVKFTLVRYESMAVCIAALKAQQLDSIVCDMVVAMDIVAKYPNKFVISSAYLTNEPLAIAVNQGNEKLLKELNDALATLRKSGKLSEMSEEHLWSDYTQNIDTTLH